MTMSLLSVASCSCDPLIVCECYLQKVRRLFWVSITARFRSLQEESMVASLWKCNNQKPLRVRVSENREAIFSNQKRKRRRCVFFSCGQYGNAAYPETVSQTKLSISVLQLIYDMTHGLPHTSSPTLPPTENHLYNRNL